jgi:hypothetical protein
MENQIVNPLDSKVVKGRQPYYYKEQLVYEWEQSLEEVFIYIKAPDCIISKNKEEVRKNLKPGQEMPKLEVKFSPTHFTLGLKNFPAYMDEDLPGKVKASECLWQLDNDEIIITLIKAIKAETWLSAFKNHEALNSFQKEEMQKKMLLERFQEEHGGFDFSDAEITGNVPDPKTFLGGIKYN